MCDSPSVIRLFPGCRATRLIHYPLVHVGVHAHVRACVCVCVCVCVYISLYTQEDMSILFPIDLELQGDILVRVRHVNANQQRVSMLRVVRTPSILKLTEFCCYLCLHTEILFVDM